MGASIHKLSEVTPEHVTIPFPNRPIRLGNYQLAVLRGEYAWSGADLKGNAKKYGAHYARSRSAALKLVNRILGKYGWRVAVRIAAHGKLFLSWER